MNKNYIINKLKKDFLLDNNKINVIMNHYNTNNIYIIMNIFKMNNLSGDFLYSSFYNFSSDDIDTIMNLIFYGVLSNNQIISLFMLKPIVIKLIYRMISALIKSKNYNYIYIIFEKISLLNEKQALKYIHIARELYGKIDYMKAYNLVLYLNEQQINIFIENSKKNINYLDSYCLALGINLEIINL